MNERERESEDERHHFHFVYDLLSFGFCCWLLFFIMSHSRISISQLILNSDTLHTTNYALDTG
jgi:hypothetical protein